MLHPLEELTFWPPITFKGQDWCRSMYVLMQEFEFFVELCMSLYCPSSGVRIGVEKFLWNYAYPTSRVRIGVEVNVYAFLAFAVSSQCQKPQALSPSLVKKFRASK